MFRGVFRRVREEAGRFGFTVLLNLFNRSSTVVALTSFKFTHSLNVPISSNCLSLLSDSSSVKGTNAAKFKSYCPLLTLPLDDVLVQSD